MCYNYGQDAFCNRTCEVTHYKHGSEGQWERSETEKPRCAICERKWVGVSKPLLSNSFHFALVVKR